MKYIKLGTTGLDVSPIAIGAMTYGEPDRGHPVWSKVYFKAPFKIVCYAFFLIDC